MTFLPKSYYLDADDMAKFILSIPTTGWTWAPVGVTWHNTGAPTLSQWDAYPDAVKAGWGGNYDHYCRVDQGWHSGPHFCATPDKSFVLAEPRADGVHASCFNRDHFGVETVGDFRHGSDDPLSGRGLASMKAAANVIAALCLRMGWTPARAVNFHRDCPQDHHACPGDLVTNAWALSLVTGRMGELLRPSTNSGQAPSSLDSSGGSGAPAPQPTSPAADLSTIKRVQAALAALKFKLDVDGQTGPETEGVLGSFQTIAGLPVTKAPDDATKAAIRKALAE